ncbi:MAG: phosphatase PAP2 family protein [Bacteroidota bacterium]|nr:phosphatase PAP2 family protein [Bacteroidota bacterium]
MNFGKRCLLVFMLSLPVAGFSQKDSLVNKLDSLSREKNSTGKQINNINPKAYTENTQLTFNTYFILLGSDLKQEFTKPFHMTKKDWGNFGKFAVATVGLSFADKPIQQAALRLRQRNTPINNISKYVTNFGGVYEVITLAGFGAYGVLFKSDKMKTTTLLATQAYITGAALETVLKFLSGRTRPSYYDPGVEAKPRFLGPFPKKVKGISSSNLTSSFPSGHTTVAFAAATVFASEYKNTVYIPVIAYSAATLIGISRITENKHWSTDVLVGAAVGFLAGKNVVNNYHRYAKIKSGNHQKNSVSFNLNYSYGHWEPGLVYKFH